MTVDDGQDDDILASLSSLRAHDVSQRHTRQLRRRCHALLQAEPQPRRSVWMVDATSIRRVIVPALGGAWCLAYLMEIVRYAAASFGYFGTQ
jgi:hypothetical protein